MSNTRGIFTLRRISEEKIPLNEWVNLDDVWTSPSPGPEGPNTGYFGGGAPGPLSTMDKLNYTNDTTAVTPGAKLTTARRALAATGSTTAGYFAGGGDPSNRSLCDKLTYASDTTAAAPGAKLSADRQRMTAT